MVTVVAGSGLGLFNTNLNQLNGVGAIGNGQLGRTQGSSFVNVATGNLLLQFNDQTLSARGADIRQLRTYNSLGNTTDGDNDRWRWLGEKRVRLEGTRNQKGSRVIRTTGDGYSETYVWLNGSYHSHEGTGVYDTIVYKDDQWVWTEGSTKQTETYHNQTGWIKSAKNSNGDGFTYTFSGDRLTHIRDIRSGQFITLTYDSNNRLSQLRTRDGTRSSSVTHVYYHYDSRGRLDRVTTDLNDDNSISDKKTYVTDYTFDGSSTRISSVSQSDGTKVSFTYEKASGSEYRVKTVTDKSGKTTFSYQNNHTLVTDGSGVTTRYDYDSQKRLTRITLTPKNGDVEVTRYEYNRRGKVIAVTDALNHVTRYTYYPNNNLETETDANGNTTTYYYKDNLLTSKTHSLGSIKKTDRIVYNHLRELRFIISAEGNVTEYQYDKGLKTKTLEYTQSRYDHSSMPESTAISLGTIIKWAAKQDRSTIAITALEYDHRGNVTTEIKYGKTDSKGVGILDKNTTRTDYVYSGYGELLQTLTRQGNNLSDKAQLQSFSYDGMGRQISATSSKGTTVTSYGTNTITTTNSNAGLMTLSTFDSMGRLTSITRQSDVHSVSTIGITDTGIVSPDRRSTDSSIKSRITQYVYDRAGRITMTETRSNLRFNRVFTFYDDAGRVKQKVDELGGVVEYDYYADGKIKSERRLSQRVDTDSWYDKGKVTVTAVPKTSTNLFDQETQYEYDAAGRLKVTTEKDDYTKKSVVTTRTYDSANRLTRITVGGNRHTHYFYDRDNRQIGVVDAEGYLKESIYDRAGRLITQYRYASKVNLELSKTGSFQTMRDEVAKKSERLSQHYFYDHQGRQIAALNEQGFLTEVEFDAFNRRQTNHTYMTAVSYKESDTLSSLRSRAGAKQTETTRFDHFGRVSSIQAHDGTLSKRTYDKAGRLIESTHAAGSEFENSTRTRYNIFGEITGSVSGEGEAKEKDLNRAIDRYGIEFFYDRMGRKRYEEDAKGQKTFFFYDEKNQLIYTIQSGGHVVEYGYDSFGQLASTRQLSSRYKGLIKFDDLVGGDVNDKLARELKALTNNDRDSLTHTAYTPLGSALVTSTSQTSKKATYQAFHYNNKGEVAKKETYGTGFDKATDIKTTREYHYDKLGRLIHEILDGKRQSSRLYDGFGRILRETDAKGGTINTRYLNNGRTVERTDALGRKTSITYDAFGRERTITDANNKTLTISYDDKNRRTTTTAPEGTKVITEKRPDGLVSLRIDGEGGHTQYFYNKDGNLIRTVDAENRTTRHSYTNGGLLFETRDANNNKVRYSYDDNGRVTRKTIAANSDVTTTIAYSYDGQGRLMRMIEGYNGSSSESRTTEYQYDLTGRLTAEIVDPRGLALRTTYSYNSHGHQVRIEKGSVKDSDQQVTQLEYDNNGRVVKEIRDPGGLKLETQFKYDHNGNVTRRIDARGFSTWYVYDKANQNTHKIDALGNVTAYSYDKNGKIVTTYRYANAISTSSFGDEITSIKVPTISSSDQIVQFIRDDLGREKFVLRKVSHDKIWSEPFDYVATENVYDKNGNIIETREFDKLVNVGEKHNPQTVITYSNLLSALKAMGYRNTTWGDSSTSLGQSRITRHTYDNLNRLRYTQNAMGNISENRYDAVGNLRFKIEYKNSGQVKDGKATVTSSSEDRKTEYRYDAANRLTEELSAEISTRVGTGDFVGRLKTVTTYNLFNDVVAREEGIIESSGKDDITSASRITSFEYDKAGRQVKTILPGWYDINQQRVYKGNSTKNPRFQRTIDVTYDDVGNAVKNRIRTGKDTYVNEFKAYDALGRLRFEVDATGYASESRYDTAGNIVKEIRYGSTSKWKTLPSGTQYWTEKALADGVKSLSNRAITHYYDGLGNKTRTVQPTSALNYEFIPDASHTPAETAKTYRAAPEIRFSYNAFGEVVEQREKVDQNDWLYTYFTYDGLGRQIKSITSGKPKGNTDYVMGDEIQYDALGNVTKRIEYNHRFASPKSNSLTIQRDDRVWSYQYDRLGRVTHVNRENVEYVKRSGAKYGDVIKGKMLESRKFYNAFGQLSAELNGFNAVTSYVYDRLGRLTKMAAPVRRVAQNENLSKNIAVDPFRNTISTRPTLSYRYNEFGQVVTEVKSVEDASARGRGIAITNTYDHSGFQTSKRTTGQATVYYKVDTNGRVLSERRSVSGGFLGETRYSHTLEKRYAFDDVGRQIASLKVYTEGGVKKVSGEYLHFNGYGDVTLKSLATGNADTKVSSLSRRSVEYFAYDEAGRLRYTRTQGGRTYFFYDLRGRETRTELRDTDNTLPKRITEVLHDSIGRKQTIYQPSFTYNVGAKTEKTTPKVSRTLDRWGNTVLARDTRDNVTQYRFNQNNQLMEELQGIAEFTYDEKGKEAKRYLARRLRYDQAGQMVVENRSVYEANGIFSDFQRPDRDLLVSQNNRYSFYNKAGQLIKSIDATGLTTEAIYDYNGNKVGTRDGEGTVHVYAYNAAGQQTSDALLRRDHKVTSKKVGDATRYTMTGSRYNSFNSSEKANSKVYISRHYYDFVGRRYREIDAAGKGAQNKYDERDNIILTKSSTGALTRYEYDRHNNKTAELRKVGSSWLGKRWLYSTSHYRTKELTRQTVDVDKNYKGTASSFSVSYKYDGFDQLTREYRTNAGSNNKNEVSYTYLENGLLSSKKETLRELHHYNTTPPKPTPPPKPYGAASTGGGSNSGNSSTGSSYGSPSPPPPKPAPIPSSYGSPTLVSDTFDLTHASETKYSYNQYTQKIKEETTVNRSGGLKEKYQYQFGSNKTVTALDFRSKYSHHVIYKYDNLGRQSGFTMGSHNEYVVDTSLGKRAQPYANVVYFFDGWGNRQRIIESHRISGSSTKKNDNWYTYDAEGRVIIDAGRLKSGKISSGEGGSNSYDKNGRIRLNERTVDGGKKETRLFEYNEFGLLSAAYTRKKRPKDPSKDTHFLADEVHTYDHRGFRTKTAEYDLVATKTIESDYREDGQLLRQETKNGNGQLTGRTEKYRYSAAGELLGFEYRHYDSGKYKFTNKYNYSYKATYSGNQVSKIHLESGQKNTRSGTTHNYYDSMGRHIGSRINEVNKKGDRSGQSKKLFLHDGNNQIVASHYRHWESGSNNTKLQIHAYLDNHKLGEVGDERVNLRPLDLTPVSKSTPGSYTIQNGDSLMTIAQFAFGDASLWYVIANANGFSRGPTEAFGTDDVGRAIRIPNTTQSIKNDATAFKAYNPGEVIGDLTPDPTIIPPRKKRCNPILAIIMIVVAFVVTVYTAGAAATAFGFGQGGLWATGTAALSGSLGLGAAAGFAAVGAAAIGGFAGSIASQGVAVLAGEQEGINFRRAFASGLTTAFSAGLQHVALAGRIEYVEYTRTFDPSKLNRFNQLGNRLQTAIESSHLVSAATNYVVGLAANWVAGLETNFSWRGFAANAAGAYIGNTAADHLNIQNPFLGGFVRETLAGSATAKLNQQWAGGPQANYGRIAVDAFGNQIVNALRRRKTEGETFPISLEPLQGFSQGFALRHAPRTGQSFGVWALELPDTIVISEKRVPFNLTLEDPLDWLPDSQKFKDIRDAWEDLRDDFIENRDGILESIENSIGGLGGDIVAGAVEAATDVVIGIIDTIAGVGSLTLDSDHRAETTRDLQELFKHFDGRDIGAVRLAFTLADKVKVWVGTDHVGVSTKRKAAAQPNQHYTRAESIRYLTDIENFNIDQFSNAIELGKQGKLEEAFNNGEFPEWRQDIQTEFDSKKSISLGDAKLFKAEGKAGVRFNVTNGTNSGAVNIDLNPKNRFVKKRLKGTKVTIELRTSPEIGNVQLPPAYTTIRQERRIPRAPLFVPINYKGPIYDVPAGSPYAAYFPDHYIGNGPQGYPGVYKWVDNGKIVD